MRQKGIILTKRSEDCIVSTGYSCNWKKAVENFKAHANSAIHLEACDKLAAIAGNVSILSKLEYFSSKEQKDASVELWAIYTTLLTLAQTGCALRRHEDESSNLYACLNIKSNDIPKLKCFLLKKKIS